jgi:hypothetical protein
MYCWDTGWEIQVFFTVGAGLRRICMKPERRPLGSSYPFFSLSVYPSVRPLARISTTPSGRATVKFENKYLHNWWESDKTVYSSHIDLCRFHCCRLHRFPKNTLLCKSNFFKLLTETGSWTTDPEYTVAFPFQTWFRDSITMSGHTYSSHFVPLLHTV